MNVIRKKNKSGTALSLEGELTIYTVTQAKTALLEDHENFEKNITLDLHGVSEIDTAGVQLLLFIKKIVGDADKNIHLSKSNEQVDDVFAKLDVAHYFTLDN